MDHWRKGLPRVCLHSACTDQFSWVQTGFNVFKPMNNVKLKKWRLFGLLLQSRNLQQSWDGWQQGRVSNCTFIIYAGGKLPALWHKYGFVHIYIYFKIWQMAKLPIVNKIDILTKALTFQSSIRSSASILHSMAFTLFNASLHQIIFLSLVL